MSAPACDVCGAPARARTCLLGRRKAMQPCRTVLCARHLQTACQACARWTRHGLLQPAVAQASYDGWVGHYRAALELQTARAA